MRVRRQSYLKSRCFRADIPVRKASVLLLSYGVKQKTPCRSKPYTVRGMRRKPMPEALKFFNFSLALNAGKGYTMSAVRHQSLCRWFAHLRRHGGVAAPSRCRYFVFCEIIITYLRRYTIRNMYKIFPLNMFILYIYADIILRYTFVGGDLECHLQARRSKKLLTNI